MNHPEPSIIALTPRYETLRFEVAVPISVIAWEVLKPKLGLSLRYGNFFIGMNDLSPLTGIAELSGIDIYAGIKLNLSRTFNIVIAIVHLFSDDYLTTDGRRMFRCLK